MRGFALVRKRSSSEGVDMRGLSFTTFKQWFGLASLLVNLSFIKQLSILSYYVRGVLLQAIEGFLPPVNMRFLFMNLKLHWLFQTCGSATWGEWSPCKIFLRYILDMYLHALFEFRHPGHHLTHRPPVLSQWTWSPVDLIQPWTLKHLWKIYFQIRTFPLMSATLKP